MTTEFTKCFGSATDPERTNRTDSWQRGSGQRRSKDNPYETRKL